MQYFPGYIKISDKKKLPNLVRVFLVTLVGNQQCSKAHESGIENVDGDVEVQNEIARSLGPRPNNRWSPVKQLGKENAASMEVTLQCNTSNPMQTIGCRYSSLPVSYNNIIYRLKYLQFQLTWSKNCKQHLDQAKMTFISINRIGVNY